MPDQIQFARSNAPMAFANHAPEAPTMSYESYCIGQLLDEVRIEPGLGRNERQVASALCLGAMDDERRAFGLAEAVRLSHLSKSATVKSLVKLASAGFIRVVRAKGLKTVLYELQFPDGCH